MLGPNIGKDRTERNKRHLRLKLGRGNQCSLELLPTEIHQLTGFQQVDLVFVFMGEEKIT